MIPARLAVLLVLPCLCGCSAIPKAEAMRSPGLRFPSPAHTQPLFAQAAGGQSFDFRISDEAFQTALETALLESKVFTRLVALEDAAFRLDVVLGDTRGRDGSHEMTTLWSLSRAATGETLWQTLITSQGRSTHFVGVIRFRRGVEYAARNNIRLGLERLSRLDLAAFERSRDPVEPPLE